MMRVPPPFIQRSQLDLNRVLPSHMDIDGFLKSQRTALRKQKDQNKRRHIKLIIEEFEKLKLELS